MFCYWYFEFCFWSNHCTISDEDAAQQRSKNINGDGHQENVYTQYLGCYRNFHWLKQILNKKEGDIFIHKLPWILRDKTGHLQTERRFHSDYNNGNKNCMKGLN